MKGLSVIKRIITIFLSLIIIFTLSITVSAENAEFIIDEKDNSQETILDKTVSMLPDGIFEVNTITLISSSKSNRATSGTTTIENKKEYYLNLSVPSSLQGTAKLTVTFSFNEQNDFIDVTSKKSSFSSSTYFRNSSMEETTWYGSLFNKKSKTVTLSYTYGANGINNSGSIWITCDVAGSIGKSN